ncbi:MAG: WD40/YVTN/BNR-like repeat-containing protein, partial [Bacteroidia bacterium]
VWKTTDHGKSWEHIFRSESGFATIGASCIALSPNNPDTMYVGTGDRDAGDAPGYGVIASWNSGKTWVSRNTGMGNVTVGRIVMHPRNSAILLAASNNGIYRSTNSGASWTQVQTGSTWDLAFHPANPSIVYATIQGSFYRSSNGGQSFTLITAGYPTTGLNRAQLAVTPAGRNYVYVLISRGSNFTGVYRSLDSGLSFNTMSTAPNILGYYDGTATTGDLTNGQGWYDLDLVADPKDRDRIYVAGINIWRSANGGSTWNQVGHWFGGYGGDDLHADQHALEFNLSGNTLIAGNDGGVYFANQPRGNAVRWTNISSGILNAQVYRMAQAQTREFTAAHGYQDNGSSQTEKDDFITYYGGDGMDCQ